MSKRKEFVVLPYNEFVALQSMLEDAEDVLDLRTAKKKEMNKPTLALGEVKRLLGIS